MQTKVVYLKGDTTDEATLNEQKDFKLQSVVHCQGQIVGYMVREPWLEKSAVVLKDDFKIQSSLPPGNIQATVQPSKAGLEPHKYPKNRR